MPSAVSFAAIAAMPRSDELRMRKTAVASPRVAEHWQNGVPAPALSGNAGFQHDFPVQGCSMDPRLTLLPLSAVQVKSSDVRRSSGFAVAQQMVSRGLR